MLFHNIAIVSNPWFEVFQAKIIELVSELIIFLIYLSVLKTVLKRDKLKLNSVWYGKPSKGSIAKPFRVVTR